MQSPAQRRSTKFRSFASGIAFLGSWLLSTAPIHARDLTFEDRVNAQAAIDKVSYAHLLGTKKSFERAIPRSILEDRVRLYLRQSEALEGLWNTPVTEEMLSQELQRMARETRMPERLQEIYTALGNDLFTIEECLARPALVSRMSRNFFAFDKTIHSETRAQADELHGHLKAGHIDPWASHPNRSEVAVSRLGDTSGEDGSGTTVSQGPDPNLLPMPPSEFDQFAALAPENPGDIGPLVEERDRFVVRVLLERDAQTMRVAVYVVRKMSWEDWWSKEARQFDPDRMRAVSSGRGSLPSPGRGLASNGTGAGGANLTAGDSALSSSSLATGTFSIEQLSPDAVPVDDAWSNGSLYNVPDPRHSHTAIWTGSEMIVWGGFNGGAYLNTGGRYNPATDTWAPVSVVDAPTGRALHTAVWTGDRMIVWGGYSPTIIKACPQNCTCVPMINLAFNPTNTGGSYDPVQDKWTATALSSINGDPAPSPRYGHAAVVAPNQRRMLVWGGFGVARTDRFNRPVLDYLDTGGEYDLDGDSWVATPFHLYFTNVCEIGPTKECTKDEDCAPAGGRCLPTDNNLNPGDMPTARWLASMALIRDNPIIFDPFTLPDAKVTIWGGYGATAYQEATETSCIDSKILIHFRSTVSNDYLPTGFGYNITDPLLGSTTWLGPTSTTGAPEPRQYQTTVWTGSRMIIWGGYRNGKSLNTGGQYDPVGDTWSLTSTTNAPGNRYFHSAVWTGDPLNRMLIWGGFDGSTLSDLNSGGQYDPVGNSWTPISTVNAPSSRYRHAAVWTGAPLNQMLIWGGLDSGQETATGGRYSVTTDSWTPTAAATTPAARTELAAVWTGSQMVTFGGFDKITNTYFGAGDLYDPATDTWTPVTSTGAPQPRSAPTGIMAGGQAVFWGGYKPDLDSGFPIKTGVSTGGRYDPATNSWTGIATAGAPTPRIRHTAVWTGSEMIVWGGAVQKFNTSLGEVQETPVNTGGRYNPATDAWTPTTTTGAPSKRQKHAAVWTGSQMIIWGGFDGTTYINSGGLYDPVADSWTPTTLTGAPTGRLEPGAVWAGSPINRMVIWGGQAIVDTADGFSLLTNFDTGGVYDPTGAAQGLDSWSPTSTTNAPEGRFGPTSLWTGTQMLVWGGTKGPFGIYPSTGGRYNPALDQWTPTNLKNVPSGRYKNGAVWTGGQMIVWGGFDGASLGSGGIYSALSGILATFYRDADADGCGDPGTAIQSSSQPAGYVTNSLDCNDSNSSVWGVPSEVTGLDLGGPSALTWTAPSSPGATTVGYDALRSTLAGDFVNGAVCVVSDATGQEAIDETIPLPGQVYFYLVRADNGCPGGEGTLGTDSSGVSRPGRSCP